MPYAVETYFDAPTEDAVRSLWSELRTSGISGYMIDMGARPHVTLAVCGSLDADRLRASLGTFALRQRALALTLAHTGVFPGAAGVVFLAPVVTRELLEMHLRLHELMREHAESLWEHYQPGRWVPHCTLAVDLEPDRVPRAVAICARHPLPLCGRLESVGVVELSPVRHLYRFPLGSQADD